LLIAFFLRNYCVLFVSSKISMLFCLFLEIYLKYSDSFVNKTCPLKTRVHFYFIFCWYYCWHSLFSVKNKKVTDCYVYLGGRVIDKKHLNSKKKCICKKESLSFWSSPTVGALQKIDRKWFFYISKQPKWNKLTSQYEREKSNVPNNLT